MQINWFTVIAQIINFLILVWLLKKFLYKPVLNAIDEREQKIAAQLKDAEARKSAAGKEQDEFNKKNTDFDALRRAMMDKATADAANQRDNLLKQATEEAGKMKAGLENAFREDLKNREAANAEKSKKQVFAIANKLLKEMASTGLEDQVVNVFNSKLGSMKDAEKTKFSDAFRSNSNSILVRSAFELSPAQQSSLNNAVSKLLSTAIHMQFKTAPELINGIDLSTTGYKLAWSFSEYLAALQHSEGWTIVAEPGTDAGTGAGVLKVSEKRNTVVPATQ